MSRKEQQNQRNGTRRTFGDCDCRRKPEQHNKSCYRHQSVERTQEGKGQDKAKEQPQSPITGANAHPELTFQTSPISWDVVRKAMFRSEYRNTC